MLDLSAVGGEVAGIVGDSRLPPYRCAATTKTSDRAGQRTYRRYRPTQFLAEKVGSLPGSPAVPNWFQQ